MKRSDIEASKHEKGFSVCKMLFAMHRLCVWRNSHIAVKSSGTFKRGYDIDSVTCEHAQLVFEG